jgi:hypothetical protein
MVVKNSKIQQQIKELKLKIALLSDRAQVLEIYENLRDKDKEEMSHIFHMYVKINGPVAYESWLLAVHKHMNKNIVNPKNIDIISFPKSLKNSKNNKMKYLKYLSLRWGLNVTIKNNDTGEEVNF